MVYTYTDNMKKNSIFAWFWLALALFATACTEIGLTTPEGEKGEAGFSAYEIWKNRLEAGNIPGWSQDASSIVDYFKFRKGQDGKNGRDGNTGLAGAEGESAYVQWRIMVETGTVDDPHHPGQKWDARRNTPADFFEFLTGGTFERGAVPHVGENGHWFIGKEDTGVKAKGDKGDRGKDALPPSVTIIDGYWAINGEKTNTPAIGDGSVHIPSITIDQAGYWVIDGKSIGVKAKGTDGSVPEVMIGANNTWVIDGTDTGFSVFGVDGKDGPDGKDGKSAYELWKEYIADGDAPDPWNPGEKWNKDWNTTTHFWLYLKGHGNGDTTTPGSYFLTLLYYDSKQREYVNPQDGSVIIQVYNEESLPAEAGVTIKQLPGVNLDPDNLPVTQANGTFRLSREQLPDLLDMNARTGKATVLTSDGTERQSLTVTIPNRINFRVLVEKVLLIPGSSTRVDPPGHETIYLNCQRQVDGQWEDFPLSIPYTKTIAGKLLIDNNAAVSEDNLRDPVGKNSRGEPRYIISSSKRQFRSGGVWTKTRTAVSFSRPLKLSEDEWTYSKALYSEQYLDEDGVSNYPGLNIAPMIYRPGKEKYVGISVGDGDGPDSDYGETLYLEDKFYMAEQAPGVRVSSADNMIKDLNVEVKDNRLWLWGEIDLRNMDGFYSIVSSVPDIEDLTGYEGIATNFEKGADNVWRPIGGWKDWTQLPGNTVLYIQVQGNNTSSNIFESHTKEFSQLNGLTTVRFRVEVQTDHPINFGFRRKQLL